MATSGRSKPQLEAVNYQTLSSAFVASFLSWAATQPIEASLRFSSNMASASHAWRIVTDDGDAVVHKLQLGSPTPASDARPIVHTLGMSPRTLAQDLNQ